ncbi:LEAF RUST DISEASE-RESISTANCE LOCUS RECEPTOR PROTEIN KINASE [Salix suchowensis]|nr:LEAF RUST DISEASE-RESISTANCE LOCUS RECEPTOR PROTEIN KINASE [Salix suchowensis]
MLEQRFLSIPLQKHDRLLLLQAMSWLILLPIIALVCGSAPVLADDDERYLNCMNSFDCGNITGAGYPFSGSDRPGYCGYPGFELRCINQDPEITIMGSTYKLHGINNQSRTLNVSRTDYIENLCPTLLSNTSLRFSAQFTCNINDTDMMGYFVTVNNSVLSMTAPILITYLTTCNNKVIVPAHQSAILPILGNPTIAQLLGAINQGFDLVWSANDSLCDTCKSSGGQCGYDQTTTAFTCFCADQPQEFECTESPQASRLGSAGAVIGAVLGCWIMALIQRRRRKAALEKSEELPIATPSSKGPATSINLSRTTPSLTSLKSDIDKGSTYFGVRVFSYDELEEVTNFFDSSRELGDGGFGTVAVKRLYENNMKRTEQFMNEIEILARIRHPNLVRLHGCTSRHSRELLLVYEYIPNGTVADHLHGRQSSSGLLTWPVRLSIAIETASALAHLHASEVIHRDVKTNNILLDNDFRVKVADFGLSRLFPTDVTHVSTAPQGTPGYVDPEYYQCYQLTSKSDVYSFGVVLIELISSLQAVDTNRHRHNINLSSMAVNMIQNQALNELVDPFLGFDKNPEVRMMVTSVAELAFRCLQRQREMRPSMEEVLEVLKRIEKEDDGAEKAEVLDISEDDVGLLKHDSSPLKLSEDSLNDQFWESSSSTKTPHSF